MLISSSRKSTHLMNMLGKCANITNWWMKLPIIHKRLVFIFGTGIDYKLSGTVGAGH